MTKIVSSGKFSPHRFFPPRFAFLSLYLMAISCAGLAGPVPHCEAEFLAGAAKIDITNRNVLEPADQLWAKALVLTDGTTTAVLITVDAVAIAEIGAIKNDFLPNVRAALQQDLQISPESILINASHCHGIVCSDIEARTIAVVKEAWNKRVPVRVGSGTGQENRVMENRRLLLKSGQQTDVRHAYSLPADEEVVGIGPIDPEIGILRLDRIDGEILAVVFNFACHPIQGIPRSAGNTADMTGFASQVIEENLSEGTIALFLQGCAGDINPIQYKQVHAPRSAEPLGNLLGLSTLKAVRKIKCRAPEHFQMLQQTLKLPRADHRERIVRLEAERDRLTQSLRGTSLNLKTFLPLYLKYQISDEFPSYYSHGYLHDQLIGHDDWQRLDTENRRNLDQYIQNIITMEELTRVQSNLALLKKHQQKTDLLGVTEVEAELLALRVGDFSLLTFPGELTVQVGLNIKDKASLPHTFVAGYTNGYLYYAPTEDQLLNTGCAQEDCDCLLGPGWQSLFETQAHKMLQTLNTQK